MKKPILLFICLLSTYCYAMSSDDKEIIAKLKLLFNKNPIAFWDLQYCVENPDEPVHAEYKYLLNTIGLLDQNYSIKPEVTNVIKEYVDGEWLEVSFKDTEK